MVVSLSPQGIQPSFKPIGDISAPSGYAAPASIPTDAHTNTPSESKQDPAAILKLAGKVLHDPLLARRLSDRVYELLLEDLRTQRERTRNYGSRY